MDAMNIALLGGGMMPGLGGNAVLPEMPPDAESFGSVLGGMMTASAVHDQTETNALVKGMSLAGAMESRTPVTVNTALSGTDAADAYAAVDAPSADIAGMSIASALDRDLTFSAGAENAMMNFIGSYFRAGTEKAASAEDTEEMMSGWQEMLTNMGSGEISQLSAFTSELETALFSGSRYTDAKDVIDDMLGGVIDSDDITWTAADVFIDVLGNRTKKKNNSDSEIGMMLAQTIAASGYTGFEFTDLMKIGESGDLMGNYSDRTVKNITAAAMKSVFGEEAASSALPADISSALAKMLAQSGTEVQNTADPADIVRTASEKVSVVRADYAPATFEEAAELIRSSGDEAVQDFTRLLSDTVKDYIEENDIEIVQYVQTDAVKPDDPQKTAENEPTVPRNFRAEAYTRINRADEPANVDVPKVDIPQKAAPVQENADVQPDKTVQNENVTGKAAEEIPQEDSSEDAVLTEKAAVNAVPAAQSAPVHYATKTAEAPEDIFTEETARSVNVQTAEAIIGRINENSRTGETELTVRLNPHSLGEITVKVTKEQSGDISVTLAAHSPETAKLLNDHANELAQLLSDRREHAAQVNVVAPAQAGSYASLDMGGSNAFYFAQGGNGGTGTSHAGGNTGAAEETGEMTADEEKIYISEEARLWTTA